MLMPKQFIPGAGNGKANAFSWGTFENHTYLAYGTEDTVIILSASLVVVQLLQGFMHKIRAIRWSPRSGRLAVGCGMSVYVYDAHIINNDSLPRWQLALTLHHDFEVRALAWSPFEDTVLVCGSSLALWDFSQLATVDKKMKKQHPHSLNPHQAEECIWQGEVMTEVQLCSFSADGRYFATAGRYDRLIKIWYPVVSSPASGASGKLSYRSIYLPHPRSIVSLSWRRPSSQIGDNVHMLLTMGRDSIARIWVQTTTAGPSPQFALAAVLQAPVHTAIEWMTCMGQYTETSGHIDMSAEFLPKEDTDKDDPKSNPLPQDEQVHQQKSPEDLPPALSRHSRSSSLQKEENEYICGVPMDGTLIIWRLRIAPGQPPKATLWMQLGLGLNRVGESISRVWPVCDNFVTHDGSHAQPLVNSSAVYRYPSHMSLYLYSTSGAVASHDFDIIGPTNIRVSQRAVWRCGGHRGRVSAVAFHRRAPLVASLDTRGHVILWRLASASIADPAFVLTDIASLPNAQNTALAWLPDDPLLLVSTSNGVELFKVTIPKYDKLDSVSTVEEESEFDQQLEEEKGTGLSQVNPLAIRLATLQGSAELEPMIGLHVIPAGIGQHTVLGITKDGIHCWRAEIVGIDTNKDEPIDGTVVTSMLLKTVRTIERITCSAVINPDNILSDTPLFGLLTGHADGSVTLWKHDLSSQTRIEAFSMATPVREVRWATPGRFSAVSRDGELVIWEALSTTGSDTAFQFRLDASLPGHGPSPSLFSDWLLLGNGGLLLVVARGKDCRIYQQAHPKSIHSQFSSSWEELPLVLGADVCKEDPPHSGLWWRHDGTLIVAGRRSMRVYTKWAQNQTKSQAPVDLLQHSQRVHSSLPSYHPRVLMEYLTAGRFEEPARILLHLLHSLQRMGRFPSASDPPIVIPDLPVSSFLSSTTPIVPQKNQEDIYSFLDRRDVEETEEQRNKQQFTEGRAAELSEILTRVKLVQISGPEQMQLLAIIDTLPKHFSHAQDLDPYAIRFMLSQKIKAFSRSYASGPTAASAAASTLGPADWIWAFHSDAQDTLLMSCVGDKPTWGALRDSGAGIWLRNPTLIKSLTEKLAKNAFLEKRDPTDCALWYLALDKKTALIAFFKAVKDTRMIEFFSRDFSKEEWSKAALKNAYVLLGKRRYELAIAFFLLAGKDNLKSAVNVCLKQLEDYQLALWLARLVQGENGSVFQKILEEHVLPLARSQRNVWLESIALWLLKRYADALSALAQTLQNSGKPLASPVASGSLPNSASNQDISSSNVPNVTRRRMISNVASIATSSLASSGDSRSTRAEDECPALTRLIPGRDDIGSAGLVLHLYRLLGSHPQLRLAFRDSTNQNDSNIDDKAVKGLMGKALYCYLHSGLALHALPLLACPPSSSEGFLSDGTNCLFNELIMHTILSLLSKGVNVMSGAHNRNEAVQLFRDNVQSLSLHFNLPAQAFLQPLLRFCERGQYLREFLTIGAMLGDVCGDNKAKTQIEAAQQRILVKSAQQLAALPNLFLLRPFPPDHVIVQLSHLYLIASELYDALEMYEAYKHSTQRLLQMTSQELSITPGEGDDAIGDGGLKGVGIGVRACIVVGLFVTAMARIKQRSHESRNGGTKTCRLDTSYVALAQLLPLASNLPSLDDGLLAKIIPCLREPSQDDGNAQAWQPTDSYQDDEVEDSEFAGNKEHTSSEEEQQMEEFLEQFLSLAFVEGLRMGLTECLQLYHSLHYDDPDLGSRLLHAIGLWSSHIQHELEIRTGERIVERLAMLVDEAHTTATTTTRRRNIPSIGSTLSEPPGFGISGPTFASSFSTINAISALLKEHLLIRAQPCVGEAWESVLQRKSLVPSLESKLHFIKQKQAAAFQHIVSSTTSTGAPTIRARKGKECVPPRFAEAVALYRDKERDLLTSFAVSPDESQIVVASVNGMREISFTLPSERDSPNMPHYRDEDGDDWVTLAPHTSTEGASSSSRAHSYQYQTVGSSSSGRSKYGHQHRLNSLLPAVTSRMPSYFSAKDVRSTIVQWLDYHPTYPYYVGGVVDGSVVVWEFGGGPPVATLREGTVGGAFNNTSGSSGAVGSNIIASASASIAGAVAGTSGAGSARVARVRFNGSGSKVAAVDYSGRLSLWSLDLNDPKPNPYFAHRCHWKRGMDVCWVNGGSVLGTVGSGRAGAMRGNVALWDTLMANPTVHRWNAHQGGAHAIAYCPRHELLATGGKGGDLLLWDVRKLAAGPLWAAPRAHSANIKSISLVPGRPSIALTASTDGSIKMWDLEIMEELECWADVHEKRTFMKPATGFFSRPLSTYGVMQVSFVGANLYSCGADGRLLLRSVLP